MRFASAGRWRWVAVAAIFMLAAGLAAEASTPPVSHDALKRLFPGKFAASVGGVSVRVIAAGNGHLTGTSFAGSDFGRWSVRRGRLCIMLRDLFDGQTRCAHVVREGKWYRADTVRFRKI